MKSQARYIAYTGLMLALCVLFQSLRTLIPVLATVQIFGPFNLSVLIIGSLVNLTLVLAAWHVGLWSGAAVSVLAPIIAFLQGHQTLLPMVVTIALGNFALVLIVWLLREKKLVGVAAGALLKFAVQYALVLLLVIPVFVPAESPQLKALPILFSWPQLVAAVIGGALALLIYPRLKKALRW
ncbi:MAG: ECF transporter S component [Oscillospiraceae bacterium]|nr:ECF transporter S component [Oscillospiraceae bacterium]